MFQIDQRLCRVGIEVTEIVGVLERRQDLRAEPRENFDPLAQTLSFEVFARDGGVLRVAFDGFDNRSRSAAIGKPEGAVTEAAADFEYASGTMRCRQGSEQRAV